MSNMFNKSRATLPRPKVCKVTDPIPAPVPETPCDVQPNPNTTEIQSQDEYDVKAFFPDEPLGTPIDMEIIPQISEVDAESEPNNRDEFTGTFILNGPEEPGQETVTVNLSIEDGPSCTVFLHISYFPE